MLHVKYVIVLWSYLFSPGKLDAVDYSTSCEMNNPIFTIRMSSVDRPSMGFGVLCRFIYHQWTKFSQGPIIVQMASRLDGVPMSIH